MDYEKKYKEALEWARKVMQGEVGFVLDEVLEKFPELKDNEDEKIRTALLNHLKKMWGNANDDVCGVHVEDAITWLEKQNSNIDNANKEYWRGYREGKQEIIDKYAELEKKSEGKPVDKVEPKFSEGDWVTCGDYFRHPLKIISISNFLYTAVDIQGVSVRPLIEYLDKHYHIWTPQDAKDGDILATDSWLYIFKYTNNKNLIQFHCNFPINGKPYNWCILSNDSYLDIYIDANIHPATKEQCDILFQKIHETGYEWDAERKELKRI